MIRSSPLAAPGTAITVLHLGEEETAAGHPTLLILREFMHHLQFKAINIRAGAARLFQP